MTRTATTLATLGLAGAALFDHWMRRNPPDDPVLLAAIAVSVWTMLGVSLHLVHQLAIGRGRP